MHQDSTQKLATLRPTLRLYAAAVLAMVILSACGNKDAAPAASGGAKPPPEVGVVITEMQPVALQTELPGRIEAKRTAQVRARVNGVVMERSFHEGSIVNTGDVLFKIDPAPYQAAYDSAVAAMNRAQANLVQAAAQAERYKPLVEANAVSKQEYLNAVAAAKQAEADVAAGKANVTTAKINLGYATVTAPIGGQIGRALVTEGALVSAAEATQLALIQQTGVVYVNVTQSANDVMKLRSAAPKSKSGKERAVPVSLILDDGSIFPQQGKLLFSDLSVDPGTGQVLLRAEVRNPDHLLMPGQYVRVRLSQTELPAGILLPQQSVQRTGQDDKVLVVDDKGIPSPRVVKVGAAQGNQWVVLEGLKPGEKVIADGFQKMFAPGAPVKPVPWKGPAAVPAATPDAAAASSAAAK